MITSILKKIFGDKANKEQKEYQPIIDKANAFFMQFESLTDNELRGKTRGFQKTIQEQTKVLEDQIEEIRVKANDPETSVDDKEPLFEKMDALSKEVNQKIEEVLLEILPEAFAVVKETSRRWAVNGELEVTAQDFDRILANQKDGITIDGDKAIWHNAWTAAGAKVSWSMVHYDVQLMGGAVLHKGNIAEMQTGEGKTLVATLPVYLNALSGKGVHLVTVNDYLAKRDSEWMGPLYQFHGLRVDCIDKHRPNSPERRNAYLADITFGTNNEFGFDYLRDNMASNREDLVQREHHFAIVDEVDSVLIDDARTPLIISGPTPKGDEHEFHELKPRVVKLVEAQRTYVNQVLVEAKKLLAVINSPGDDKKDVKTALEDGGIALLRAYRGLPKNKPLIKFLSEPGIKAHLQKVENTYMAEQGKHMKKIDAELFFVIDEKNNTIELTEKGINLISDGENSDFYVIPDIGGEIAKLQKENLTLEDTQLRKDLLIRDFSVKSERIHSVNQLLKAYTLFEKEVEYVIMDSKVKIVDEQTGRIMEGRRYSDGLHQAIEAKENVTIEAATQTYATITLQNYFRMYHKLAGMTGTAETEAKEFWDIYKLDVVVIPPNRSISRKDLNDLVFRSAREKFSAVIDETERLVKEGRPVLVGTTTVEISEFLSRSFKMRGIPHQVLNAKQHQKEAEIVAEAGKAGAVTIATNMAGRGTDIKLGEGVKEAGGLAIIGTERHDSRRVDRQLRGRAGRQGDPGSSQFFVSLEDNLMRLFGSERIASLMDRMGLQEGEVIQHSMISKSIERAQKKVEENHFGTRKRLIEYDDVMNAQRDVVYKRRRNALNGDRISIDIANMIFEVAESLVSEYHVLKDFESFNVECIKYFGIESPFTEQEFKSGREEDLAQRLFESAEQHYRVKSSQIAEMVFPVIKDVYTNPNNNFENIVTPFTDGIRSIQVMANLKKSFETNGREMVSVFEKTVILAMIDDSWKEHLREMDDLKQSVQNASLEQKDPLVIYKLESFNLFRSMIAKTSKDIISFLMKGGLPIEENNNHKPQLQQARFTQEPIQQKPKEKLVESRSEDEAQEQQEIQKPKQQPIRVEQKIGRNDPCPCGSGKKYKSCHGIGVA